MGGVNWCPEDAEKLLFNVKPVLETFQFKVKECLWDGVGYRSSPKHIHINMEH